MSVAFNATIISRTAADCVSWYIDLTHKSQEDVRVTGRTVAVMLYGLKNNMSKAEFKFGLGEKHEKFRFSLARKCVKSSLRLSDQSFRMHGRLFLAELAADNSNGIAGRNIEESTSGRPSWLTARVLTKEVMQLARKFHQCLKSELPELPSSPEQLKALHICRHVRLDCVQRLPDRRPFTAKADFPLQ